MIGGQVGPHLSTVQHVTQDSSRSKRLVGGVGTHGVFQMSANNTALNSNYMFNPLVFNLPSPNSPLLLPPPPFLSPPPPPQDSRLSLCLSVSLSLKIQDSLSLSFSLSLSRFKTHSLSLSLSPSIHPSASKQKRARGRQGRDASLQAQPAAWLTLQCSVQADPHNSQSAVLVGCLLTTPATCLCMSGTDLLRQYKCTCCHTEREVAD